MAYLAQKFAFRLALVVPLSLPSVGAAQIADLQNIFDMATSASLAWSEDNAVVVDPRLTYEIAAGIRNFSQIFLRDDAMAASARELLTDRSVMGAIVAKFLGQSYSSSSITHVFELLAARVGVQSGAAGYTDTYLNRYVMVRLPDAWEDAVFLLDDRAGSLQSGHRALLGFGSHAVLYDGRAYMLHVVPDANDRFKLKLEHTGDIEQEALAPFWVQPNLEWFCDDIGDEFDFGPDRMQILASERAPFYQADRVRIQVLDQNHMCTGSCQRAMSAMIVRSLAQWRSGCSNCGPVSLKFVEIGEEMWVDDSELEAIEIKVLHNDGQGVLTSPGSNFLSRLSFRPRSQTFANGFRRIDGTPYAAALCKKGGLRMGGAYFYDRLCGEPAGTCTAPACMQFTVGISRVDAECTLPASHRRVACARPNSHIAFNSDHIIFTIGADHRFGASDNPIRIVDAERIVYHEVGHWFRLPHIHGDTTSSDGRTDIMSESPPVTGSLCIRASTLALLDHAVMGHWEGQLTVEDAWDAPEEWE